MKKCHAFAAGVFLSLAANFNCFFGLGGRRPVQCQQWQDFLTGAIGLRAAFPPQAINTLSITALLSTTPQMFTTVASLMVGQTIRLWVILEQRARSICPLGRWKLPAAEARIRGRPGLLLWRWHRQPYE